MTSRKGLFLTVVLGLCSLGSAKEPCRGRSRLLSLELESITVDGQSARDDYYQDTDEAHLRTHQFIIGESYWEEWTEWLPLDDESNFAGAGGR